MPADIASKPYDPEREYKHVYICRKYPMLRMVYERKQKAGDVERYIGFLKHAAGGIFQTDDKDVAAYLDSFIDENEHGHTIEKISHEDLGAELAAVPASQTRVNRGPMASRQADRADEPAPQETPKRAVGAARGPKRGQPKKDAPSEATASEPEPEPS